MSVKFICRLIMLAFLAALLPGCKDHDTPQKSNLRFADFLLPDHPVKVTLSGPEKKTINLVYGEATPAVRITEGKYRFRVITGNEKVILEQELGIGKQTNYTVTISGILLSSDSRKNPETLLTRLRKVAEGATAFPGNAAMPVMSVFLDRFEGNPDNAKLKAVHMAPGLDELDLYVKQKGKLKKLTTLEYPRPTEREYALPPGSYPVEIRYKSSEVVLYRGNVRLKAGRLTTLFIFGDPGEYPYKLKVNSLVYTE